MVLARIVDSIASRLAFFPPTPPSYKLENHGDLGRELYIQPSPGWHKTVPTGEAGGSQYKKVLKAEVAEIPIATGRGKGDTIVVAYIKAPTPVRFTLLHSHGNAVDLGQMLPYYEQLAKLLHVNVCAYDYRGYGQSSPGTAPTATLCLVDISTTLEYIMEKYQKELKDIVLYGQSIGSGPTVYLASRKPGLAGCVLHSPLLSGLRVLRPTLTRFWPSSLDIFSNIKEVPKIRCRTLIMHVS